MRRGCCSASGASGGVASLLSIMWRNRRKVCGWEKYLLLYKSTCKRAVKTPTEDSYKKLNLFISSHIVIKNDSVLKLFKVRRNSNTSSCNDVYCNVFSLHYLPCYNCLNPSATHLFSKPSYSHQVSLTHAHSLYKVSQCTNNNCGTDI